MGESFKAALSGLQGTLGCRIAARLLNGLKTLASMAKGESVNGFVEQATQHIESSGKQPILGQVEELESDTLEEIFRVGRTLFSEGNSHEAADVFLVLSLADHQNEVVYHSLGIAEQARGQYKTAAQAYQVASALSPGTITPKLYTAECYIMLNKLSEAQAAIDEALDRMNVYHLPSEKSRAQELATYLKLKQ